MRLLGVWMGLAVTEVTVMDCVYSYAISKWVTGCFLAWQSAFIVLKMLLPKSMCCFYRDLINWKCFTLYFQKDTIKLVGCECTSRVLQTSTWLAPAQYGELTCYPPAHISSSRPDCKDLQPNPWWNTWVTCTHFFSFSLWVPTMVQDSDLTDD